MILNLVNLRAIANTFNAEFARRERNEHVDFLPLVIIAVLFVIGINDSNNYFALKAFEKLTDNESG